MSIVPIAKMERRTLCAPGVIPCWFDISGHSGGMENVPGVSGMLKAGCGVMPVDTPGAMSKVDGSVKNVFMAFALPSISP